MAPEVYRAISYLIQNGELDEKQFQRIGFAALKGSSEGFVRGSISAAITIACKSGMLGEALKGISPSIVGMATVLAMDTMKNAYKVAAGQMSRTELASELVRELIVSSTSLAGGAVVGFMIGSFVGSVIGSFVYNCGYSTALSFCVDTGFTMFCLVKQNYTLPKDIMEAIGLAVFQYEQFTPQQFEPRTFSPTKFNPKGIATDTLGIHILRRGVIGVSEVGYI